MTDKIPLLRPNRKLTGISAILLPFTDSGDVDYPGLAAHLARTAEHGLTPAVNMDTGFGHLIDDATKRKVLAASRETLGPAGQIVAGAFVSDQPGAAFNGDEYKRQMDLIQEFGGTPVIFQSYGLTQQADSDIVAAYETIATGCDQFIGFELTPVLGPFGSVYNLQTYEGLMEIPKCIGAKHSSFERQPEWVRLQLRDAKRPDFKVFTGNDFGIDMVMYGSDYLLGLSTFCPDLFAKRDAYWETGDAKFYELNDLLQYLGFFSFRSPGPGYKHSAAQFMKLRGWIDCDNTHPQSPNRPDSDVEILRELGQRLGVVD